MTPTTRARRLLWAAVLALTVLAVAAAYGLAAAALTLIAALCGIAATASEEYLP